MTEQARLYGVVLYQLAVPEEMAEKAEKLLYQTPELVECLASPIVSESKKHRIIERIFQKTEFSDIMIRFLKKACDGGCIGQLKDIIQICKGLQLRSEGILKAELDYVTLPDEAQKEGIREFLCRTFGAKEVQLTMKESPQLLGGFVLKAGDMEYDYSLKGQLKRLTEAVAG